MMNDKHTIWVEKYRPVNLDTYIGNDFIKSKIKTYLDSGDIPHLLLYGKAGVGKTTLAKILVNNIDCDYIYINASDERNIDTVRDRMKTFASSAGFNPLKIIILDESDYLNLHSAQPALRNLMETFSAYCRFILTCNYVERIIDPIQSRCQSYKISPPSRKEVALHLKHILEQEKVDFKLDDVAMIVNSGYPDIRRVVNSAQRHSVNGVLNIDVNSIIAMDYKIKLLDMIINKEQPKTIRKFLADNSVSDYEELYRLLYDNLEQFSNGNDARCILALAEGQYQESHVVDKEINFMATLIKIMELIK